SPSVQTGPRQNPSRRTGRASTCDAALAGPAPSGQGPTSMPTAFSASVTRSSSGGSSASRSSCATASVSRAALARRMLTSRSSAGERVRRAMRATTARVARTAAPTASRSTAVLLFQQGDVRPPGSAPRTAARLVQGQPLPEDVLQQLLDGPAEQDAEDDV